MKVGVITHWWCFENYGQLLQGYAFQKYLEQQGHFGFIIKYYIESAFSDKIYIRKILLRLRSWDSFKKGVFAAIKRIHRWRDHRERRIAPLRDFDGFRAINMNYTEKVYKTYSELVASDEISADMYSVGSDLVWKMLPFNDDGRVMFLDFGAKDVRRISYSASFGDSYVSKEYKDFVAPLICNLDAVSVREPTGVDICNQMGRYDAVCVMDPVFLLGADFYRQKFNVSSQRAGVYGYFLDMKPQIPVKEIIRVAQEMKQEMPRFVTVYADMGLPQEYLINPTLPRWIRMIGSAKLFVTNSFHGTAMAIILHTPFIVLLKHNRKGMDNRLLGLLGRLNLLDRIYDSITNDVSTIACKPIDWGNVEDALRNELQVSFRFLRNSGI